MIIGRKDKRGLMATLMKRKFEQTIRPIVDSEKSFKEIDKKVDPMLRRYMKELETVWKFYGGKDNGETVDEESMKGQKCCLIDQMMTDSFEDSMFRMLSEAKSIEEADKNLEKYMQKFYDNQMKLYSFYGIEWNNYEEEE